MDINDSPYIPELKTSLWPSWMPQSRYRPPRQNPPEFTVNIKGKTHVLYTGLVIAARANGLLTLAADWTYNDAELSPGACRSDV